MEDLLFPGNLPHSQDRASPCWLGTSSARKRGADIGTAFSTQGFGPEIDYEVSTSADDLRRLAIRVLEIAVVDLRADISLSSTDHQQVTTIERVASSISFFEDPARMNFWVTFLVTDLETVQRGVSESLEMAKLRMARWRRRWPRRFIEDIPLPAGEIKVATTGR
jgi:hypothetical protein